MLSTPFLTALDERAWVKGSRDPLGLQAIWARFGRHVIGNLTTVTDSLRDFTTLLLGADLVERVSAAQGPETELETFLRWEQLGAYARVLVNDEEEGIRGRRQVVRFLEADRAKVTISAERQHQILGNQATYGIWGMYTATARASGLLEAQAFRLTPAARELVDQQYYQRLAKGGAAIDALEAVISRPTLVLAVEGRHRPMLEAVADVLGPRVRAGERLAYRHYLLEGGPEDPTAGRQAGLVRLLEPVSPEEPLSPRMLERLSRRAQQEGEDGLAHRLDRIRTCESLLAPLSQLFGLVLARDGSTVGAVARDIDRAWGKLETLDIEAVRILEPELGKGGAGVGERLLVIAEALVVGDHQRVVEGMIEQNRWVMETRGGAPWVTKERNGVLKVRAVEEPLELSTKKELASLWRYPYFISSLRTIMRTLQEEER